MRGYRTPDYLTQAYLVAVGLLVLLFHNRSVPCWALLVGGHAALVVGVHVLIRLDTRHDSRLLDMLHGFYPMLLFAFFYWETHILDSMFLAGPLDAAVLAWDERLFGCQPSQSLVQWLPHLAVSEFMNLSYFSYYIMIPGVGFALYYRDRTRFFKYMATICTVFFFCYLMYIFLPVLGPYATHEMTPEMLALLEPRVVAPHLQSGLMHRVMGLVYRYLEPAAGAAFPSSHVAIAVTTLTFTWRYLKRIRAFHLAVVVFLAVSTVYCGYHYAVDVLAGILWAAMFVPVAEVFWGLTTGGGRDVPPPPDDSTEQTDLLDAREEHSDGI